MRNAPCGVVEEEECCDSLHSQCRASGMCSDRQSDCHDVSVKNIRLGNLCLAADSVTLKRSIVVMP